MPSDKTKTACVLVVTIFGACESDGNDFTTGVPPSKTGAEVTDAEAKTICEATVTQARQTLTPDVAKSAYCKIVGVLVVRQGGAAAAFCQVAIDQCMMMPLDPQLEEALTQDPAMACANEQSFGASCTATVAEYETCVTDQIAALEQMLASIPSCAEATMSQDLGIGFEQPASCGAFEEKCPGQNTDLGGLDLEDFDVSDLDQDER